MKKIILTGGGTAGHVTPNMALMPYLRENGMEIHYIGSRDGIEKELIAQIPNVIYHPINSGKMRRYFSLRNFTDPFRVVAGFSESIKLMKMIKPDVVFSKGGFVAVPVVAAAHFSKVPVICHESDITPGLANKLSVPFANRVCVTFPDVLKYIKEPKGIYTGSPIRADLFHGDKERARKLLGFDNKPVLLMMGGSLGAQAINNVLRESLCSLLPIFNIIHICGKGNIAPELTAKKGFPKGYAQFEFVSKELPDFFALTDYVLSRAGSNSIHEFLALKKPMLLIPLPLSASRGDQILNAKSFARRGFALMLEQEELNSERLVKAIMQLKKEEPEMKKAMEAEKNANGTGAILKIINDTMKNSSTAKKHSTGKNSSKVKNRQKQKK